MTGKNPKSRPVRPPLVIRDSEREARAVAVAARFGVRIVRRADESVYQLEERTLNEIAGPAEASKWH